MATTGRKKVGAWVHFQQLTTLQTNPPRVRFQCLYCDHIVHTTNKPRADRIQEHLAACKKYRKRTRTVSVPEARDETVDDIVLVGSEDEAGQAPASGTATASASALTSVMALATASASASTSATGASSTVSAAAEAPTAGTAAPGSGQKRGPARLNTPQSKRRPMAGQAGMESFVIKTTAAQREKLKDKLSNLFYLNNLPFRLADSASFRSTMEELRPGINGKDGRQPVITRKMLAGTQLERTEARLENDLASEFEGKYGVVSQDGWSDIHAWPVIASCLIVDGQVVPLDFEDPGPERKTAEVCADYAKNSILRAEEKFKVEIVAFVSDNEAKMVKTRQELRAWRPGLIVLGCNSHYLNLVESTATPHQILSRIVSINRAFREHHALSSRLKVLGGRIPQLPNKTRWTSQQATLETFLENLNFYREIAEELGDDRVPDDVALFLEDRQLKIEAKHMKKQLDHVSAVLNTLQSDSANLSDAMKGWLSLVNNDDIMTKVKDDIKVRMEQAVTLWHKMAFILDNRNRDGWPEMPEDMVAATMEEVVDTMGEETFVAMTSYQGKEYDFFPRTVYIPLLLQTKTPKKYWEYVVTATINPMAKSFAKTMSKIFSIPPSSAGIEREFSAAGICQTKLRNRLQINRIGRLIKVNKLLKMKEGCQDTTDLDQVLREAQEEGEED